ncbi:MAG: hypothetical protein HY834_08125 [Devosia nanyangense]|uniref:Inner membrane protein n=1 Tax=Devosia nanyangense TaxID=1228055 RepID=A0A933L3B5_9HYPH|nr:hypothetical protein [Devosia nanyangense]
MAERSTGPVKPPVIDLTARKPEADPRPEPKPASDAAPGSHRRNDAPPRFDLRNANWPLLGGAAIGGAVLGTLLTYLVAGVLPLPTRQQAMPPDLTMEVTAQGAQLDTLEATVGDLQRSTAKTQVSLDATIAQLDAGLTEVKAAIAGVEAAIPPPATVDLAPIEAELKTLKAQIDAIAAGASGADAGAIAQSLSTLETGLTSLTTRIDGVDAAVVALRTGLDAARKTLTDHIAAALPNEAGPALKLPLILSGLESAFASGKPFATELTSLAGVLPDLAVPDALRAAAASGISRPDALMQDFEAALPDILAARAGSGGDWVQSATDWAKALLALRPAGEIEGDSPEAIVSRLEGAMGRRDYATAEALIGQLPAPMQAAAAPVASAIALHAAADQLVTDLRTRALAPAGAPA